MRRFLFFSFLAILATVALAWTKEDYEVFDLVSALEAAEGKGTTFYSYLDVPSTASVAQIQKAYRKKSLQLHPDKNPGVPKIQEKFARLGVIANILRTPDGRERYDFFYKNGVPKWRGTGYYYSRFRPGLGTVLVFLIILTSGLQYVVQRMNYSRDVERIERIIRDARLSAWGQKMVPVEGRRKVKVNLGGGSRLNEEGNVVPGRMIDIIVENDEVYILDPSGELHLLDTDSAISPAVSRTWFVALLIGAFRRVTGRQTDRQDDDEKSEEEEIQLATDVSDSSSSGRVTPSGASEVEGPTSLKAGHVAAAKAGGRRRKAVKKR
ncbi:DnaJ-domain-containing protein [Coniophora puteana RWD-64-598 SS2]|uniref:DnaJ-domain-containing protein n=1 Tax=Coniophora puteana (strain RWD-64-598) TaxID=741705 RepID=A0A5M3MSH9_CONPW|nr:DnaJ-domain-containing protein [Coniophora puteana RWD-64-598 SS2]EIW82118.1 DnaJ-domain-containing protein [Coniophora puteana RWD-64-598 SS2]